MRNVVEDLRGASRLAVEATRSVADLVEAMHHGIAATRAPAAGRKPLDDGLVPVNSALGRHARPELTLEFPSTHQWIAHGMAHQDLLSSAEVYEKLRSWLSSRPGRRCC